MKYYIGKIDERNGDYEYNTTIKFETEEEPEEHLLSVVKSWYIDEMEYDSHCDAYHNGEGYPLCSVGSYQEITKDIYDALTIL